MNESDEYRKAVKKFKQFLKIFAFLQFLKPKILRDFRLMAFVPFGF